MDDYIKREKQQEILIYDRFYMVYSKNIMA